MFRSCLLKIKGRRRPYVWRSNWLTYRVGLKVLGLREFVLILNELTSLRYVTQHFTPKIAHNKSNYFITNVIHCWKIIIKWAEICLCYDWFTSLKICVQMSTLFPSCTYTTFTNFAKLPKLIMDLCQKVQPNSKDNTMFKLMYETDLTLMMKIIWIAVFLPERKLSISS